MLDGQKTVSSNLRAHHWGWLRRACYPLWGLVAVALFGAGAVLISAEFSPDQQVGEYQIAITGLFRLTTHDGRSVTEWDFRGKPTAWFLGFTNCPDVCPTTLMEFTDILGELGSKAEDFTPVFVTVDPERDTQRVLSDYMQAFDSRIVALTGTLEQVNVVVRDLRAHYRKQASEGGNYSMDHTATVYLMDRKGRFQGTLDSHEDQATQLAKVERLLSIRR